MEIAKNVRYFDQRTKCKAPVTWSKYTTNTQITQFLKARGKHCHCPHPAPAHLGTLMGGIM